ncbi:hypothetical protein ABZY81_37575 [Streptomyces sp. NPDC006514]
MVDAGELDIEEGGAGSGVLEVGFLPADRRAGRRQRNRHGW